jgi:hypothetical protein
MQDLVLNKSSVAEIGQQLWPQGLKLPRLCRLPKTCKEWGPIRPIVTTIGTCTYCLLNSCKVARVTLGQNPEGRSEILGLPQTTQYHNPKDHTLFFILWLLYDAASISVDSASNDWVLRE